MSLNQYVSKDKYDIVKTMEVVASLEKVVANSTEIVVSRDEVVARKQQNVTTKSAGRVKKFAQTLEYILYFHGVTSAIQAR